MTETAPTDPSPPSNPAPVPLPQFMGGTDPNLGGGMAVVSKENQPFLIKSDWVREAWNAAPDGILLVNQHGCVMASNAAMSQICGRSQEELQGQPVEIFLPDALHDQHRIYLRQFFTQPRRHTIGAGRILWLQRKDGVQVPVDIALGNFSRDGASMVVAFVR
ncbi:MAG: PAS domain S-box protein, partial [Comamonas sp.]|nr:PAS domain S-box protein [Candidatus Comamonas equi]